jgi:hypothetical protein
MGERERERDEPEVEMKSIRSTSARTVDSVSKAVNSPLKA